MCLFIAALCNKLFWILGTEGINQWEHKKQIKKEILKKSQNTWPFESKILPRVGFESTFSKRISFWEIKQLRYYFYKKTTC